jgi:cytochrome d ubiquinol oxidase subunit II
MLSMHGGYYIACKTEGPLQYRAQNAARFNAILVILLFLIGGYWITQEIPGYIITSTIDHQGPSNPLFKTVTTRVGAWLLNYYQFPILWIFPILGLVSALAAALSARISTLAFICSGLTITGILGTTAAALFPFILPSSSHPEMSLTVWDASSSHLGLWLMLIATIILLPLVLGYTTWVYRTLRGKV